MQGGKFAFFFLVIEKAVADLNSGFFFRQNKINLAVGRAVKAEFGFAPQKRYRHKIIQK